MLDRARTNIDKILLRLFYRIILISHLYLVRIFMMAMSSLHPQPFSTIPSSFEWFKFNESPY